MIGDTPTGTGADTGKQWPREVLVDAAFAAARRLAWHIDREGICDPDCSPSVCDCELVNLKDDLMRALAVLSY